MSMIGQSISIGELARRADCKPETVRYYAVSYTHLTLPTNREV